MDFVGMAERDIFDAQIIGVPEFAIAQKAPQAFGIDGH
jgi:hypothetical protein